jgi:hypothetical protein
MSFLGFFKKTLEIFKKSFIFVKNFKMTTTLEITILDDSEADLLLLLLQKFRSVKIGKVNKNDKITDEDALHLEKFDAETQRLILDSIERHKNGDNSHLISIDNPQTFLHAL